MTGENGVRTVAQFFQINIHAITEVMVMKTDAQLKKDIEAELEWDPAVNDSKVGVAVHEGVVTVTGHLDSYAEKRAVEKAVQRVACVRGIALELDVKRREDSRQRTHRPSLSTLSSRNRKGESRVGHGASRGRPAAQA